MILTQIETNVIWMEEKTMHNENKVFNPKNMSKLEHPDRYKELPPIEILNKLGLEEGQNFGDFGCGIGFFSIPAANIVGETGHVYASDISQQMLDGLNERLDDQYKNRVTLSLTGIDSNILDVAMISTVLHEVDSPEEFLKMASKSVKLGGTLGVIEWIKEDMPHGPKMKIRISENEMKTVLEISGFKMEKAIQLSQRFYLVIARKV